MHIAVYTATVYSIQRHCPARPHGSVIGLVKKYHHGALTFYPKTILSKVLSIINSVTSMNFEATSIHIRTHIYKVG